MDGLIERWLVDLVRATRQLDQVTIGASVRGSLALERAARAWALLHGRATSGRRTSGAVRARARTPHRARAGVPGRDTRRAAGRAARDAGRTAASSSRRSRSSRARATRSRLDRADLPPRPALAAGRLPVRRLRASRRGLGSSVAGSRPYRVGDSLASIDWNASARLSSTRDEPEFVVREHFADESPRVVMVGDRRPSMGLYPDPWLSKPAALRALWKLVSSTALGELGLVGYLDAAGPGTGSWLPPSAGAGVEHVERHLADSPFAAGEGALDDAFAQLVDVRRSLPPGTFVFVCSDFLSAPRAGLVGTRARVSLGRRPGDPAGPRVGAELPGRRAARRAVRGPGHGPDLRDPPAPRRGRRAATGQRGAAHDARRRASRARARAGRRRELGRAGRPRGPFRLG